MATNEKKQTNGKFSMNFDESGLADKANMLGEEITIISVGEEKLGNLGGKFSVADIEYDGEKMQVAFGVVLNKQFESFKKACVEKGLESLPCKAVLAKNRGKRYFEFETLEVV